LYEEVALGFLLPQGERARMRGKVAATNLLIQTKSAGGRTAVRPTQMFAGRRSCRKRNMRGCSRHIEGEQHGKSNVPFVAMKDRWFSIDKSSWLQRDLYTAGTG
jgi:hypothetical protein